MRIHLIGIGGVGMSALAQALLDRGDEVSGSDRLLDQESSEAAPVFEVLRRAGARLLPQDGSGIRSGVERVVVSSAVEGGNADLEAAKRQGIPVCSRAEALAELIHGRRVIAVAGTAGKTTVTAMIGWVLERLGADPLVINGGELVAWARDDRVGSVRSGRGEWAVVETDESDRSLLRFRPAWTVVTNVSRDHFDEAEIWRLFRGLTAQTSEGVVAFASTMAGLGEEGLSARPYVAPEPRDTTLAADEVRFRAGAHTIHLRVLGEHNAANAALALTVLEAIGYSPEAVGAALAQFSGVRRRLERIGRLRTADRGVGAVVFDDYAHNPAKIAASWRAVSAVYGRILGVWRPHGFGPLALMFDELCYTFRTIPRPRDLVFLLPVYYAGGTACRSRTTEDLVSELRSAECRVEFCAGLDEVERRVRAEARSGDAVLVMGARDPGLSRLCRRLAEQPG